MCLLITRISEFKGVLVCLALLDLQGLLFSGEDGIVVVQICIENTRGCSTY